MPIGTTTNAAPQWVSPANGLDLNRINELMKSLPTPPKMTFGASRIFSNDRATSFVTSGGEHIILAGHAWWTDLGQRIAVAYDDGERIGKAASVFVAGAQVALSHPIVNLDTDEAELRRILDLLLDHLGR